ncbi:MAG: hypothetical protein HY301_15060 [Verrucomicrobia bacterium]|nr:hypothetical protein [Verrucomicrobiota bacterium]
MKTRLLFRPLLTALATALLLAGCATGRVDWNSRVGTYTLDQAVVELGPPEKQAKLSDGTVVAEWMTSRTQGMSRVYVGGHAGYGAAPTYVEPAPSYENYVRLTFSADGRLTAWQRFTK